MILILVFGHPEIKEDRLALEIAEELKVEGKIEGVEFVKCNLVEKITNYRDKEFYILDVVKGIDKVILIDDIEQLKERRISTLHDFDLGFYLKLLKEIGELAGVKIIGIPEEGNKEEIKKEIKEKIVRTKQNLLFKDP